MSRAKGRAGGSPPPVTLSRAEARRWLLHSTALGETFSGGAREVLARLGVIQLDPIDRVGPNAELVAFARLPELRRGELHAAVAGRSFEHFAKERCILDARFFPWYRDRAVETPWWRGGELRKRVDEGLLADVLAEIRERGPLATDQLTDRGKTEPMDWSGWKSTASRSALGAHALWTRCAVVVAARDSRGRHLYDVPERALGEWAGVAPEGAFGPRMVVERVRSAGLLARAGGPTWSMLADVRTDGTVPALIEAGEVVEVQVEGQARPYLALPSLRDGVPPAPRVPLTVLGPLDPLLWDRALVGAAFGFDYVWEIYKPAAQRRWGYYVCPLLRDDALVGRVEARREGATLVLDRLWIEDAHAVGDDELDAAMSRLAAQNRCTAWARGAYFAASAGSSGVAT